MVLVSWNVTVWGRELGCESPLPHGLKSRVEGRWQWLQIGWKKGYDRLDISQNGFKQDLKSVL
jgi:hypothetical protein